MRFTRAKPIHHLVMVATEEGGEDGGLPLGTVPIGRWWLRKRHLLDMAIESSRAMSYLSSSQGISP